MKCCCVALSECSSIRSSIQHGFISFLLLLPAAVRQLDEVLLRGTLPDALFNPPLPYSPDPKDPSYTVKIMCSVGGPTAAWRPELRSFPVRMLLTNRMLFYCLLVVTLRLLKWCVWTWLAAMKIGSSCTCDCVVSATVCCSCAALRTDAAWLPGGRSIGCAPQPAGTWQLRLFSNAYMRGQ